MKRLPIRLLPEAKAEFDAAVDYYKEQRAGLGRDFIAQIRAVLRRIAKLPRLHAVTYQMCAKL